MYYFHSKVITGKKNFFLRFYLFRERVKGREISMCERYINWVASHMFPSGNLARNPSMCPGWELNRQPVGLQASAQSTEPQQPGHHGKNFKLKSSKTLSLLQNQFYIK